MSEQVPNEAIENFSERLNEFMGQVVLMHNRLFELEKAVGYLLTKDPEWMEAFKKAQSEEAAGEQEAGSELVIP